MSNSDMSNSDNVEEIMEIIRSQIKNRENDSNQITSENIVEVASIRVKERLQKIRSQNSHELKLLEHVESLSIENIRNLLSVSDNQVLEDELHNANLSFNIQIYNKIDTSKPKIVRNFILKIRNMLQNEV